MPFRVLQVCDLEETCTRAVGVCAAVVCEGSVVRVGERSGRV